MGLSVKYECMRHHPFIFYRQDFAGMREHVNNYCGAPYNEVLDKYHSGFFSEFNMVAAYCVECTDRYVIKPGLLWDDQHVRQFWSCGQTPHTEMDEITRILQNSG